MVGVSIACTACGETGKQGEETCIACDGNGFSMLDKCPRAFVGQSITEAINVAGLCGGGTLPVSGGLMDQSAWFLSLWQTLQSEEAMIDMERHKRRMNG